MRVKTFFGVLAVLAALAAAGFLVLAALDPEGVMELQERFNRVWTHQSEAIEVTPVKALEIQYDMDVDEIWDAGCDPNYDGTVYTWFRDLGRDLWLPYYTDLVTRRAIERAAVCGPEGVIKWLEEGVVTGSTDTGEVHVPAAVLEELPEGDYWLACREIPEGGSFEEGSYLLAYIAVRDHCGFHTEDYRIAPAGDILFDRSGGEGFTFHLANLGDNIVTDVWRLQIAGGMDPYHVPKHLEEGRDYVISGDGASVTLTPEYLDSLTLLYQYHFRFGLGDHSTVSATVDGEPNDVVTLVLTDGPLNDPPEMDGPRTYALSSGEDYTFTLHQGQAFGLWAESCVLKFQGPEGEPLTDAFGSERNWFSLETIRIGPDGTYTIPASVFREAAAQSELGSAYIGLSLQLSSYSWCGYYAWYGYGIEITP